MARGLPIWILLMLTGCDCGSETLQVEGPNPYVRCLAFDVDEGPLESAGATIEGHTLSLEVTKPIQFFSVRASTLPWLAENENDDVLQVVLGGFARDAEEAVPLLSALAARGPALLILGGDDDVEVFQDALDELSAPNLISLLGVRRVDLGGATGMVVVHGAPNGRYARGDSACGYSPEDLALLADDGEEGDLLVSWMVPSSGEMSEGVLGQQAGDDSLAQLVTDLSLDGGVHAWPTEQAGFRDLEGKRFVVSVPGGFHVSPEGGRFFGEPLIAGVDGGSWSFGSDSP
ncbi:MAG: hypothetical protein AB8H86_25395 [Polyangiales bacterium]